MASESLESRDPVNICSISPPSKGDYQPLETDDITTFDSLAFNFFFTICMQLPPSSWDLGCKYSVPLQNSNSKQTPFVFFFDPQFVHTYNGKITILKKIR
ncbi:hypothetical protein TWF173_009609 [Orbilia oligospora]|nr:hypothetical protein TWF173_009609 [Orbilia oligospora]